MSQVRKIQENGFFENKVEEALQLLSANNELLERQNALLEEFMNRIANMQAEHNLAAYLQDAKIRDKIASF